MNRTAEPNATWTKDLVEESYHLQVVVLLVSAVTPSVATAICHHQQNGRTSTLIYTCVVFRCSLGIWCVVSVGMM